MEIIVICLLCLGMIYHDIKGMSMKATAFVLLLGLHGCQAMDTVGMKRKVRAISEDLSSMESERIHKLESKMAVLIAAHKKTEQDMKKLKAQHDVLFFSYKHMIDTVYDHHSNMEKLHAAEKDLIVRVEDLEMRTSSVSSLSSDDEFMREILFISDDSPA